jgi:hypothetical protein
MASSFVCEGIDLDGSTASGCRTCRRGSSPAGSPRPRVIGWNGAGGCAIFSQARQENLSRTVWTTFHWRGITLALDVPAELDQFAAAIRTRARRRDHYPLARQISRKGAAGRRAAFNTLDRPTPGAASQRRPRPLTHPLARPASSSSSSNSNGFCSPIGCRLVIRHERTASSRAHPRPIPIDRRSAFLIREVIKEVRRSRDQAEERMLTPQLA